MVWRTIGTEADYWKLIVEKHLNFGRQSDGTPGTNLTVRPLDRPIAGKRTLTSPWRNSDPNY